jgi:repressor LexA
MDVIAPGKEARKIEVLEAINRLTNARGYPPSYRDLGDEVGLAHSAVFYIVETLRADGLIHEREAKHSRAITLTDAGRSAVSSRAGWAADAPGYY